MLARQNRSYRFVFWLFVCFRMRYLGAMLQKPPTSPTAPPVYRPASAAQRKPAPSVYRPSATVSARLAPPAYRPQGQTVSKVASQPSPRSSFSPRSSVQMWPKGCTCHKHPHRNDCPLSKARKAQDTQVKKEIHVKKSSWQNMQDYRPGWIKRNDITEARVENFCSTYENKRIRGHGSGDNSQGEQDVTTFDLGAYKLWHEAQWGWY
jgi:hypothetical protein